MWRKANKCSYANNMRVLVKKKATSTKIKVVFQGHWKVDTFDL